MRHLRYVPFIVAVIVLIAGNVSSERSKGSKYRRILGVSRDAGEDDIKVQYRKLAKRYHPDKHRTSLEKEAAQQIFVQITEAYEYLTDTRNREKNRNRKKYRSSKERYSRGDFYDYRYSFGEGDFEWFRQDKRDRLFEEMVRQHNRMESLFVQTVVGLFLSTVLPAVMLCCVCNRYFFSSSSSSSPPHAHTSEGGDSRPSRSWETPATTVRRRNRRPIRQGCELRNLTQDLLGKAVEKAHGDYAYATNRFLVVFVYSNEKWHDDCRRLASRTMQSFQSDPMIFSTHEANDETLVFWTKAGVWRWADLIRRVLHSEKAVSRKGDKDSFSVVLVFRPRREEYAYYGRCAKHFCEENDGSELLSWLERVCVDGTAKMKPYPPV